MAGAGIAVVISLLLVAGAGVEAKNACDPAGIVGRVAASCSGGVASAGCCKALLAPVDLGGGFPCLCSGAAQPHLADANVKMDALYRACTGGRRGGGGHLLTACQEARRMLGSDSEGAGCDGEKLGYQIDRQCGDAAGGTTMECCEAIVTVVDTKGCFCAVMNSSSIVWSSSLSVGSILDLYQKCGGLRSLHGQSTCQEVKVDATSSGGSQDATARRDPSPRAANPATATPSDHEGEIEEIARHDYVLDVVQVTAIVIVALFGTGYSIVQAFKKFRARGMMAQQQAIDTTIQNAMFRFLNTFRDEVRSSMQEQVTASIRDTMHQIFPDDVRRVRAASLIELATRNMEPQEDGHEENGAAITTSKKKRKRKIMLKGESSTSEIIPE